MTEAIRKEMCSRFYQIFLQHVKTRRVFNVICLSFTYGVASLQLSTAGVAPLGVSGVVFLHCEDSSCPGNRGCCPVEG